MRSVAIGVVCVVCLACAAEPSPEDAARGSAVSCETVVTDADGERRFCIEYPGATTFEIIGIEAGCEASASSPDAGLAITFQSTFARAVCSREGVIGGCAELDESPARITWHYDESEPGAWRAACERDGRTWLEP